MKSASALGWMGWIFGLTVAFEILTLLMGAGQPGKVAVRLLFLAILFVFLLKGYRFSRFVLGALYLAAGALAVYALLMHFSLAMAIFMVPFGTFSLAAAWFFFQSRVLRTWTDSFRVQSDSVI